MYQKLNKYLPYFCLRRRLGILVGIRLSCLTRLYDTIQLYVAFTSFTALKGISLPSVAHVAAKQADLTQFGNYSLSYVTEVGEEKAFTTP